MNRIDRIARKIVAANMFFDRKEWKEFHKKVTDSHRYFGRNKEFHVDFTIQMNGEITSTIRGPHNISLGIYGQDVFKPLEENIKRAQYFLNDLENLKHSLSAAIDYANKTAKALQKESNNLPEDIKKELARY